MEKSNIPCKYYFSYNNETKSFNKSCKLNDKCKFSHVLDELNYKKCPNNDCFNICKGKQCRKCHLKTMKNIYCKRFFRLKKGQINRNCSNRCPYSHDEENYKLDNFKVCKECGELCYKKFDICYNCFIKKM